ncbi:MAG: hypothetical protein LUD00_12575 [Prevotellaceae bacterium]|nr:hypothetical protein [Prevotellaceae bacterium]
MKDEIIQDGKVVLWSTDGINIPMIYKNLTGRNHSKEEYSIYMQRTAFGDLGLKPGIIRWLRDGTVVSEAQIPAVVK